MAILDTALGRIVILIAAVSLAFAGGWLRGHHTGWAGAQRHDSAVVQACMAANGKQQAAIEQLQQANAAYASAAAISEAEQTRAKAAMDAQHAADVAALTAAQKRLDESMRASPSAAQWASERVPQQVADALR